MSGEQPNEREVVPHSEIDIHLKVIDDRGNELMVVKNLSEAETAKT